MMDFSEQAFMNSALKTNEAVLGINENRIDIIDKPKVDIPEETRSNNAIDENDDEINFDFEVNCEMAPWRTLDRRC